MKFTLRDLIWLTALAAIGTAWFVDRSRLADRLANPPSKQIQIGNWEKALNAGEAIKISYSPEGTLITETLPPTDGEIKGVRLQYQRPTLIRNSLE